MSPSDDISVYFAAGAIVAEKCVYGCKGIEENYNYGSSNLRTSVYLKFKREIIYFRIFISYFEFQTELDKTSFEYFLTGFQDWLKNNWDNRLLDRVQDKLNEYGKKFIVQENNYLQLKVTDNIVDELLINSGFDVDDYFSFDRTELKRIFRVDLKAHKIILDRFINLLLMDSKERLYSLKEMSQMPPLTIYEYE